MNKKTLIAIVGAALLLTGACKATVSTNSNTNTNKPAATPTATPASSPASSPAATPATSTDAGAAQDFTLVNATGVEIDKLFVSPHDANEWGEDILGQDTLADGQKVAIKFHPKATAAEWDLRIEDSKGNSIEWKNLNLLTISKVTLHYADGKGTAETE